MGTLTIKRRKNHCLECDHREVDHGDRAIGGICAAGKNPYNCYCTGYRTEKR